MQNDQAKNAKFLTLKMAIQKGLDSGVSNKTIPYIMKEVEARMIKDGRLLTIQRM